MFKTEIDALTRDMISGKVTITEAGSIPQNITVSIPLLVRFLEWAREDAKTDEVIHEATERLTTLGSSVVVGMNEWDFIVGKK